MATKTAAPSTFYPKVSAEVPWETRKHLQLIYQKLNNHALAFAQVGNLTGGTTTTTIENFGGGGSGGGSPIVGLGGVNDQSGNTTYTTTVADNGVLLVLDDASPIAVTLSTGISSPWMIFVTNIGAGTATLTPMTGTVNGGASLSLPFDYSAIIAYDGADFWATVIPIVPKTTPAVLHQWLKSYDATTGLFTQTQPAFTDISGQITVAQGPAAGLSVTITTAALTTLGAQGSQTFVNGILTAQVQAT